MSRRCMPSECPRHTVTAVVARNSASASQVKYTGPPISAASVMAEIHSDLTGFQHTTPSTASVSGASNMRGERKVPCEAASAASTGSGAWASRAAPVTPSASMRPLLQSRRRHTAPLAQASCGRLFRKENVGRGRRIFPRPPARPPSRHAETIGQPPGHRRALGCGGSFSAAAFIIGSPLDDNEDALWAASHGSRGAMSGTGSNNNPERGFLRGLQNYGDRDFSIYMRRAFARSMGYTTDELARPVVGIAYTHS